MAVEDLSRRIVVTDHAVQQYHARWMSPEATLTDAEVEIAALIREATPLSVRTFKRNTEMWQMGDVRAVVQRRSADRCVVFVTILPRDCRDGVPSSPDDDLCDFDPAIPSVQVAPESPPAPRAALPAPTKEEIQAADIELQAAVRDQATAVALSREAMTWVAQENKRVESVRARLRWLKTRASQARAS